MSELEPDAVFRKRLICLVSDELRPFVRIATGPELDAIGRRLDRFRAGAPHLQPRRRRGPWKP